MTRLTKPPYIRWAQPFKSKTKQTGVNTSRDYNNFITGHVPGLVDDEGKPVNQSKS